MLLVLAAAAVGLCLSADDKSAEIKEIEFSGERDILRANFTYDAGTRTLRGTQTMEITNRTGAALDSIVLRLHMNGQDEDAVAVSAVSIDGEPVSGEWDDPTVLRIAYPWRAEHAVSLSFTLMIKHEKKEGAAIVTLPSLAAFEDGAWRTDAYDELTGPSYGEAFDFTVSVDNQIAAQMCGARDASFALLPGGKTKEKEISGARIRVLARDAGRAGLLLEQTQAALKSLDEIGVAYPFDMLTVAQSDTGFEDGAAYSGLIALDTDGTKEELRRRITRLTARQTFGILVQSDPWNAPWLSAAPASCCELLAYRSLKGEAAYEERFYGEIEPATRLTRPQGVSVGGSTAHFGSDREMTQVLRDQGAAMLLGIERAVGEEAFIAALSLYIQENAGGTGTLESLCSVLESATGSRWDGYLADGLSW